MKIVKLTAENIKKLVAVEITPAGNVVKISGKNGAGKTSILDAIWWGLGGTENIQAKPIRTGEKKAKIELDLGDILVRRTFTEKGSSLVIENKEGLRYGSPQAMLDSLLGKLSFDPLGFMRLDAAKQFETLKSLTGVDTSDIETKKKTAYEERTAVNRDLKTIESRYNALSVPLDCPDKELSSSDITAKITAAADLKSKKELAQEREKQHAESIDRGNQKVKDLNKQIAESQKAIEDCESMRKKVKPEINIEVEDIEVLTAERAKLDKRIEAAIKAKSQKESAIQKDSIAASNIKSITANIETAKADITTAEAALKLLHEKREALKKEHSAIEVPDTEALQVELANVDSKNKAFRTKQEKSKLKTELDATKAKSEKLSADIDKLDEEKQSRIASAKFPVEGLTFGDGFVSYNGLPLEQASDAEKLRVSMAMAMAMNPKLRILRIRDGSLLDSASMKIVEGMAKDRDYQIWIECISDENKDKLAVYIEDGMIQEYKEPEKSDLFQEVK
jgi:DNA repair exonuclease SbcCD ATPase subunit